MKMPQYHPDMDELEDRDRVVLEALADGRANPKLIRNETGLDKGDTNTVLVRLSRAGYVEQVTRGLYELTEKGRAEVGQTILDADDVAQLRRALDNAEAAAERGDGESLKQAIERARDVVDA